VANKNRDHRNAPRQRHDKRHQQRWFSGSLFFGGVLVIGLAMIAAVGGTAYAINLENHDSFCASCHTEPESQYYQNSLQTPATTLSAFHVEKSVRCIDCHSGSGPLGRVLGLEQGAKDLFAYVTGKYHSPAITTNPLSDQACLKCHPDVAKDQTFNNHFHVFLSQWQSIDPHADHCVDCHTTHIQAQASQAYLITSTVQNVCQACHAVAGEG
jgi:hypothetical protein